LLTEKCVSLEAEIESKDDALAETENEIFQLRQETDASASAGNIVDMTLYLHALKEKDARIAHLEKSKLTKDQLEKIKQVKEDRARLASENKELKKQCEKLKLKSTSAKSDGPNDELIKSLNTQIADFTGQVKSYEAERHALFTFLQQIQFNTAAIPEHDKQSCNDSIQAIDPDMGNALSNILELVRSSRREQVGELEQRISVYKDAARTARKEIADLAAKVNELEGNAGNGLSNDISKTPIIDTSKVKTPARVTLSERKTSTTKQTFQDENDPRVNKPVAISSNEAGDCAQS